MNTTVKDTIEKMKWFAHPIDKVWNAITENDLVSQWLVPTDFKAEVGATYSLKNPKDDCDMVTGKVIEATPYRLVYSWINETAKEVETLITWNLVEENNGTTLTMVHSGISNYSDEVAPGMIESYTGGWNRCFDNLGEILS